MDRLRSERIVEDTPPSLDTFPTSTITVCFHNCRSLQRHIDDFKHESNLLSSDIIGLAETRVWGANAGQFEVDGFQLISATADQSAHGLAIYCRCNVNIDQLFLGTVHHIEYCLIGISKKLVLGFVYCPPNKATILSISSFLSAVSATVLGYFEGSIGNIVLMGDFNFDSQKNKSLSTLFGQTLALRQLVSCITTDYDSCIDHIYSNLSQEHMKMFGTLESYYSDHKPLFCNIYV
jgi:exonuclease III